jgi:hypothetical protein
MDDWPAEDAPRFVEQDGMYRQFDMTGSPDYACIVGHEVLAITPIREDYRDRLVGFAMTTDSGTLRAWAEGDEFWVEVRPGRTEVRVSRAPGR